MSITGKDFRGIQIAGTNPMDMLKFQTQQPKTARSSTSIKDNINSELGQQSKTGSSDAKIDEAATQFEALLLHQMFQSMWSTVQGEGILSGSKEEEYFRDMFTQGLADTVAKGQGIGIKEVIAKEMYKSEAKGRGTGNKE